MRMLSTAMLPDVSDLWDSAMTPSPEQMIHQGALFVLNDSGGKDSQAMKLLVRARVPVSQIMIIHAVLPEVDWDGIPQHIERYSAGLPIVYARATKTFFDMVEHRRRFPSAANRQCTSDLKRGPIEREIRRYLKLHPEFCGRVVNCMGMRAAESASRAKLTTFRRNEGNCKAGREWYDWLPVHHMTTVEVYAAIETAGQEPHWAYAAGMSRLSCCFCIMASRGDLTTAARLNPGLYRRYVETEKRIGHTLSMSRKPLTEITGVEIE